MTFEEQLAEGLALAALPHDEHHLAYSYDAKDLLYYADCCHCGKRYFLTWDLTLEWVDEHPA
jgi:hypothetical protein